MYGEVRVEADGVYVEERDEGGVCVCGEFIEKFRTNGCGYEDEGIRLEGIRPGEP